jgi:hypothetical protein
MTITAGQAPIHVSPAYSDHAGEHTTREGGGREETNSQTTYIPTFRCINQFSGQKLSLGSLPSQLFVALINLSTFVNSLGVKTFLVGLKGTHMPIPYINLISIPRSPDGSLFKRVISAFLVSHVLQS